MFKKGFRLDFLCLRYFSSQVAPKRLKIQKNLVDELTVENQHEILSDVVTPLWKMEYKDQLYNKRTWARMIIGNIKSRSKIRHQTKLHAIIPSPEIDAYRNKDEFSIRTGVDFEPKTVGFFVGSPAEGRTFCVPPHKLKNIKPSHIEIAEMYQDLIRKSDLNACHDLHDGGFWRGILVRSNNNKDHMIVVCVHPNGASDIEKAQVKQNIIDRFSPLDNVKSIYYQECPHTRCTNETWPFELLHGEAHIYENIGRFTFRISPDSFFQINTQTTPLLYESALGFLDLSNTTTVLDLCCGTGTLSILASDRVRGCIGIETVEQAVNDAKFNAQLNDITNCHFFTGKIEQKLKYALRHLEATTDISAIINPGRAGVDKSVIEILRNCPQLRRLVYISCKADSPNAFRNLVSLGSKTFSKKSPFRLTDVQPVDMFPHTNHCELVLSFCR